MSRNRPPGGVIAAVLLPRDEEGRPRWDDFERMVDFLCSHGLAGVCVNGATGEYPRASQEERRTAVAVARRVAAGRALVVAGEGSASTDASIRLAAEAEAAGADAHLVPPPFFFSYEQDDVAGFYRAVAAAVARPVLIYRLPCFTSDVSGETVLGLIRSEESIHGIKDSSGSLDVLARLAAEGPARARRLVGNDNALVEACRRNLCHGVISGVACVLPELISAIWEAGQRRDLAALDSLGRLLAEAIAQIDAWPAPVGLQVLAGIRGLCRCLPAVPLSARRRQQAGQMQRWFEPWWERATESFSAATRSDA